VGCFFFCLFFFHPAYASEGRSYTFCDPSTQIRILLYETKRKQSSREGRRMCWKHGSRKALRTKAREKHKDKTQAYPVGFVTAFTLAAPIEHATFQCYQNYCQQKDLQGDITRSVKRLQILSQSLLHLWKVGTATVVLC